MSDGPSPNVGHQQGAQRHVKLLVLDQIAVPIFHVDRGDFFVIGKSPNGTLTYTEYDGEDVI